MHDKRRKGDEKQTERIEVRLGVTLRDQFLSACKRAGDTPSDVLRAAMSDYVGKVQLAERKTLRQELMMKLIHNPLKTAIMALTSLAAFALVAAPSSADERLFKALDSNGDGVLTETDSAPLERVIFVLDADDSESITLDEFRTMARYGRLFQPEADSGRLSAQSDRVTISEDSQEIIFSGEPNITFTPPDENGDEGLHITENAKTVISLVTIDLSAPGEVRFKSENMTLDALRQIDDLNHIVIEIEEDLMDNWPAREQEESETP